ncbi:MAG: SRPBCC family protein [Pseudomonadota bacterium]
MSEKLQYTCLVLLCFASTGFANTEDFYVDIQHQPGNIYVFELSFLVNATPEKVLHVLTDYENLHRLNSSIRSSRILDFEQPGITRVEVVARNCILFFCKTLTRVEDVRVDDNLNLEATLVPELSNFKSGETFWTFTELEGKTRVTMQGQMVPDFWVPPLIGPHTIMKRLRQQMRQAADKLNELTRIQEND